MLNTLMAGFMVWVIANFNRDGTIEIRDDYQYYMKTKCDEQAKKETEWLRRNEIDHIKHAKCIKMPIRPYK